MARTNAVAIEIQKFLKGMKYPAGKNDLIKQAKQNKADKEVISRLEELKVEKFKTPADVSKAIGE
ncbi:MAG TPA: DUF2795 domain-containing protein [Bacteroidales bacterium]|nr:DUF2795 domain-containing protein [Bacteroidales bacterium]